MFDFKFDWCKEMECGVQAIDDQHQILFHIGREMEQLIMHGCQNATTKELLDIICELREYTSYHFYTEEDLMLKYHYPQTDQHKQSHAVFRASIIDIDLPGWESIRRKWFPRSKTIYKIFCLTMFW